MRYVAAYLLVSLGGRDPSSKDILKVLDSVGIEAESVKVDKVISVLNGKSIDDFIVEGSKKLAFMPAGRAAASVTAAPAKAGTAPAGGDAPAKKEEKKEEKKKEESEESEDDMGFGLFD